MNINKYLIIISSISLLCAQLPINVEPIVYKQMMLLKSKLGSDPIVWQDTREGYLRNRAVRICETALDSLSQVPAVDLIKRYYPELDSLFIKINDGKEYDVRIPKNKNYQINYFFSSS